MSNEVIEVLARGVCIREGKLLLCHTRGASNTYLPGGHVEFEEPARKSLQREILEELGRESTVGRFLGGVEHGFIQDGHRHSEINLVFELDVEGVSSAEAPSSCEDHIEFVWAPLSSLATAELEPLVLRDCLVDWCEGGAGGVWASTLEGTGS